MSALKNNLAAGALHIVIDAGNTRIKVAQYQNQTCEDLHYFEEQKEFEIFLKKFPKEAPCIFSNTGSWDLEVVRQHFDYCLSLNPESPLPYIILYSSPKTLGNDRRALAAAAHRFFPGEACLVLDLGTCLTADFIDAQGNYHGGAISPGLKMRFKSLKHFTANLPKVDWSGIQYPNLVGDSTENSILSGVVRGYAAEISASITQYEEEFGAIRTVITGGDHSLLLPWLKNDIFAPSNFLLNGLDYILEYNLRQK
ncbi:type III pantothenate kinase [Croceimicrobium hydrocarbonivorans]|uniref:Type III pantothenate kinase n=1 Tax=Croceimicrobium hydrocarbonivorans TaxID=2761580 RepID=A0A7H0VF32_9FLAO|nr:type III pantothenate kinase [Croceimicrobium hydrocarbonivorans]QNR24330.1 type III pantothenate kinase [Croceimicrobium hydrocarbonivorans]